MSYRAFALRVEMIPPWIAVLTTTKRPQYLRGTLEAIDAAGGGVFRGNRIVFVDGPLDQAPSVAVHGWTSINVSGGGPPRGSRRSTWRVLHLAAVAKVPYLLFFEDDVRMSRNTIGAMAELAVPPGLGFLAFLNQRVGLPSSPAIRRMTGAAHFGNQALKIPDRTLALFRFPSSEPIHEYAYSSDVWLGGKVPAFGIVLPALVRHVGTETTIPAQIESGFRPVGLNYAGDDYDALGLAASLGRVGLSP